MATIYVFEQKYEKYQRFSSENFQFLEVKLSVYLNRRVFVITQRPFSYVMQHMNKYFRATYE